MIFVLLVFALSQYVWRLKWNHWMLSLWPTLTFEEKAHINDNMELVLLTLGIPIIMYFRNEKWGNIYLMKSKIFVLDKLKQNSTSLYQLIEFHKGLLEYDFLLRKQALFLKVFIKITDANLYVYFSGILAPCKNFNLHELWVNLTFFWFNW